MRMMITSWIKKNILYFIGALVGGISGFFYWKYIGCLSGTCRITSNPYNSIVYFAIMGTLLFGLFARPSKQQTND